MAGSETRSGAAAIDPAAVGSFAMRPMAFPTSERGWVHGLALAPDGTIWAVCYRNRVLRSTDEGDTWEEVPSPTGRWLTSVAATPDGAVLAGDEKGHLHETRDAGRTWEHTPLRGGKHIWALLVTPEAAFAGCGGNVHRRRHGEAGWTPAKKGPRGSEVRRLWCSPDGVLLASCASLPGVRAAWRSLDGGDTWGRVLTDCDRALVYLHGSAGRAYALLDSGALLSSDDGGDTWARHPHPFTAPAPRLWSAGPVVYAFDVPRRPPTGDEIGEVWRSPDGGDTWRLVSATPMAVRAIAATARGDLLVGGELGGRPAVARLRDPEVAAFLAAHPPAPARPAPPAAATGPTRVDTPASSMLARLLTAWRARRHPELAERVERLGAACATGAPPTSQAAWMSLAKARRAQDLSPLVASWRDGTMEEVKLRFEVLARFDDDPRVAAALADFVRSFAYGATSSKPLWTAVGARLVALRDPRTVATVGGAARGAIPVGGATMKAWLGRYVQKLASELEGACAAAPALDAADRALCAEADRLAG